MWFILAALIRLGPPVQTIPPPARMQQPLQELIRTEVVYPQEKHETQITVASAIDRHRDARAFSVPLHLEHGLSDSWQIEAEWTPYVREVAEDATVQGT